MKLFLPGPSHASGVLPPVAPLYYPMVSMLTLPCPEATILVPQLASSALVCPISPKTRGWSDGFLCPSSPNRASWMPRPSRWPPGCPSTSLLQGLAAAVSSPLISHRSQHTAVRHSVSLWPLHITPVESSFVTSSLSGTCPQPHTAGPGTHLPTRIRRLSRPLSRPLLFTTAGSSPLIGCRINGLKL